MHELHDMRSDADAGAVPLLSFVERPLVGMVNLRGDPRAEGFAARVGDVIGTPFPVAANRFVEAGGVQCVWQGPDEWLLTAPLGQLRGLVDALEAALAGLHHAVTDVTGQRLVFRLKGRHAAALLASGCSLDLDAEAFPTGSAAQTLFAGTTVSILKVDPLPSFDIHVRRSFKRYLQAWIVQAAGTVEVRSLPLSRSHL